MGFVNNAFPCLSPPPAPIFQPSLSSPPISLRLFIWYQQCARLYLLQMKKPQEKSGIRVRHLQHRKLASSDFTLINEVTVLESLVEDPTPVLRNTSHSRTPRKKIFEGYTRSPRCSRTPERMNRTVEEINRINAEMKEQDGRKGEIVEVLEVVAVHKAGQPIVLPNPLNIMHPTQASSKPEAPPALSIPTQQIQTLALPLTHSSKHSVPIQPTILEQPAPCRPPQPIPAQPAAFIPQRIPVPSSQFMPLQNFLKLPPKAREQILEQMNPMGGYRREQTDTHIKTQMELIKGNTNSPVVLQHANQQKIEIPKPLIQKKSSTTDPQILLKMEQMQKEIENLTRRLCQKQKGEEKTKRLFEQYQSIKEAELQKKQSEISQHIIKISELSKVAESKTKEVELLRYQLKRQNNEGKSYDNGESTCDYGRKYEYRNREQHYSKKPAFSPNISEIRGERTSPLDIFDPQNGNLDIQEQFLSPLSVNLSRNQFNIEDSNEFKFLPTGF